MCLSNKQRGSSCNVRLLGLCITILISLFVSVQFCNTTQQQLLGYSSIIGNGKDDSARKQLESENIALNGLIDAWLRVVNLMEHQVVNHQLVPPSVALYQTLRCLEEGDINNNVCGSNSAVDDYASALTKNAALEDAVDGLKEVASLLEESAQHDLCWGKICIKKNYLYSPRPAAQWKISQQPKEYKWSILVTVNSGFIDFLLNWLSFYDRLQLQYPVYIMSEDFDVTGEQLMELAKVNPLVNVLDSGFHMTGSFALDKNKKEHSLLTSKKPGQILRVLNDLDSGDGEEILDALLFIDLDTVWLDNPFPDIESALLGRDMATQTDTKGMHNTGFVAVPKTERNVLFLEKWRDKIEGKGDRSQPAFNELVGSGSLFKRHPLFEKKKFGVSKLPILVFPSGGVYLRKDGPQFRKWGKVVHANGIGEKGHEPKRRIFEENGLWSINRKYNNIYKLWESENENANENANEDKIIWNGSSPTLVRKISKY